MKNKFSLNKLSLAKQLLIVFGISSAILFFFVVPLIDYNMSSIVDKQMYDKLKISQDTVIHGSYMPENRPEEFIFHIIYDYSTNSFVDSNVMDTRQIYDFYNLFEKNLISLFNSDEVSVGDKGVIGKDVYYYMITRYDVTKCLISIVGSDYSDELFHSIRNHIIYALYIFFVLSAIVIFLWVLSLIRPMSAIKNYIDDFNNRKENDLTIDRGDEIGIIFKALEDMKKNIEKQEKQKEEMIHNISHDLKTPIAIIQTYGQSVKDDIYPYGDKDSSMDVIIESADRLEKKVKSLLLLNRLDFLNNELKDCNEIEMKSLLDKIVLVMDPLNPEIQLNTQLDDVVFVGEEEHWRIVIENVIENANRYAKTNITIILKQDYLEIYNDGTSIDEESVNDLFDPYVKGVNGQFGLGLSIVKKICQMYRYHVYAVNKHDGVSFIIEKIKE